MMYSETSNKMSNTPAAPNAGIASQLTGGHCWLGIGEPERYAKVLVT